MDSSGLFMKYVNCRFLLKMQLRVAFDFKLMPPYVCNQRYIGLVNRNSKTRSTPVSKNNTDKVRDLGFKRNYTESYP